MVVARTGHRTPCGAGPFNLTLAVAPSVVTALPSRASFPADPLPLGRARSLTVSCCAVSAGVHRREFERIGVITPRPGFAALIDGALSQTSCSDVALLSCDDTERPGGVGGDGGASNSVNATSGAVELQFSGYQHDRLVLPHPIRVEWGARAVAWIVVA